MSFDRFYCPDEWGSEVFLTGPEAHHMTRVLRKSPGERIEIFDGRGRSAVAEISEAAKKSVTLAILRTDEQDVSAVEVILAVAAPKGDRLRLIIEKATELGVRRFIPISTERSVVEPRASKLEKLEQTVIAACKQCGRNTLMEIAEPTALTNLQSLFSSPTNILVGSPVGMSVKQALEGKTAQTAICIVIGPEGGFTDNEIIELAVAGSHAVRLGQYVLRVETAAISLAAAVLAHC